MIYRRVHPVGCHAEAVEDQGGALNHPLPQAHQEHIDFNLTYRIIYNE